MFKVTKIPTDKEFKIAKEIMSPLDFNNFCREILELLMVENKDVLERLKNC